MKTFVGPERHFLCIYLYSYHSVLLLRKLSIQFAEQQCLAVTRLRLIKGLLTYEWWLKSLSGSI